MTNPTTNREELNTTFETLFQIPAPKHLRKDYLERNINWFLEAERQGFEPLAVQTQCIKLLKQTLKSTKAAIKPGTRLFREWNGTTYEVEVLDNGYEYQGLNYKSLSHIAHVITGTRWSGPRFFGLTK